MALGLELRALCLPGSALPFKSFRSPRFLFQMGLHALDLGFLGPQELCCASHTPVGFVSGLLPIMSVAMFNQLEALREKNKVSEKSKFCF
jgi:hypothetical protein